MIRTCGIALALVLLAAGPAAVAQPTKPGASSPPAVLYLCIYKAGPGWQAGKPLSGQALGPHGQFIKRLLDDGRLVAGGPMLDADAGLAIVRAANIEEAKAIFAADPALTSGIFVGEVHAWLPAFDSGQPLKR